MGILGKWEPRKVWLVFPDLPCFCSVEVPSPFHCPLSLPCNTCLESRWKRVFFFRRWNSITKLYGSRYLRWVQTWGEKSPEDFPAGLLSETAVVSVSVQTSLHGFVQFPSLALRGAMATHVPVGSPCLLWFCGHLLYSSSLVLFQAVESCCLLVLLYAAVLYLFCTCSVPYLPLCLAYEPLFGKGGPNLHSQMVEAQIQDGAGGENNISIGDLVERAKKCKHQKSLPMLDRLALFVMVNYWN